MDVVLTGAAGYLGSRVALALDRAQVAWRPLAGRLADVPPSSLTCTAVIHCAGALRGRADVREANLDGTASLARGLAGRTRVVFVSSRSVYPRCGPGAVSEQTPPAPWDPYGESKWAAERVLGESGHTAGVFRASAIFGHPHRARTFADHALDGALGRASVTVADPDREVDYVDVDWLAALLVRAARDGAVDGLTLNAAGPRRSLHGMLADVAGALVDEGEPEPRLERVPLPVPAHPLLETERLRAAMACPPHPSDREVFRRMVRGRRAGR